MIAGLILCASLTAVDGDTVKCDGQNMRLLGEGVPFVSGIDTPEIGSHAKCLKERKLALIAKGRLKELLAEKGLRVVFSGSVDRTASHRRLVNIYRANGKEIGQAIARGRLCPRMEAALSQRLVREITRIVQVVPKNLSSRYCGKGA